MVLEIKLILYIILFLGFSSLLRDIQKGSGLRTGTWKPAKRAGLMYMCTNEIISKFWDLFLIAQLLLICE